MTLFSCARRGVVTAESTTSRVSTTVSISAASTMRRISECVSATCTNSVRSSSNFGGVRSIPMIASISGSFSRNCASRPPQYVDRPVMRMRLLSKPDALALAHHLDEVLLDDGADLVRDRLHEALVLPGALVELVGADRRQEADLELRGQIARHAEQAAVRERRRQRQVERAGELLQRGGVGEDRRGPLGADQRDGDDRRFGPHRRLDEPAAPEAAQLVA